MAERSIAVLTTGRQDLGILRSTLHALQAHAWLRPSVWAGGMHLSERHGRTIELLREDGITVHRELAPAGAPGGPPDDAARMLAACAAALREERPDALFLVGDRTETAAAALAACIVGVPIVHLHGGEESEGAVDNALRHAITKLAHLHLVSHDVHAARVRQMGEPADSVIVVGPAGVDNLHRSDLADEAELSAFLGGALQGDVLLVTHHPATLGHDPAEEADAIGAALASHRGTIVVTQPNADAGAEAIRAAWGRFAAAGHDVRIVETLGERRYWGLLRRVAAVIGNSSSGVIEAPAAGVPSLTIGDRQRGRLLPAGVIAVPADAPAIQSALHEALSGRLRFRTDGAESYPDGAVAPRIIAALEQWQPPVPAVKRFEWMPNDASLAKAQ